MDLNDSGQKAVEELGAAINSAVENSARVADAISKLRQLGYELELTLRLEIGLRHDENAVESDISGDADNLDNDAFHLTEEDLQILRRMKIGLGTNE